MDSYGYSLDGIISNANQLQAVHKQDVHAGDVLVIKTNNSVYRIAFEDEQYCLVSGGWFDKKGLPPTKLKIAGCTWGGSVIKVDIIAACGLRMEFSNRLVTTTIQRIFIFRAGCQN